ncbi:ABC transporter ATP-binding protein [Pseudalkalibacillus decolorationis]|uniref:ABC transporter ATP-binding protein n=1 Tax=Pseudalkalibacillus decolorationis TaxID=163879 RepID=UPI00214730EB|nr:ATP-binding cassette domain-containing protein [Pseudalkalibacillus decolorationis]
MSNYLIETNGLIKSFGNFKAVNGIDLKVPKGEIYGFLGPNGAGKSTTIRMLLGLIKPTQGMVQLFGRPLKSNRLDILKKVGSMVESPSYYGHLSAYENLNITRKILELPKSEVDRVLQVVRLTEVKDKLVKKFSLGMKQRLGIAQALLGNPELLLLDEPTNGLDPSGIHEIRDLIKRLPFETGMTVLVSSHILSEVELIADQVGVIQKGEMIFQGTLQDLRVKGSSTLIIDANPMERALVHIEQMGYTVQVRDGRLYIPEQTVDPAEMNKKLVMNNISVRHLSEHRDTLEEIFLSITREDLKR